MFQTKNITKKFGSEYALRNISIEIGKGLFFIIGASGSGKTTLLRIISGMEPDFEGEVFFRDQNLKTMKSTEKSWLYNEVFGFVWQDFNLLDDRTVLENVLLPRYLKDNRDEKQAMNCLRELKIDKLANQKVGKLSGGQKQRVAIARELMKDPQVILADEPTSALDRESALEIMAILRSLSKRRTVIVVTHDTSLIKPGDAVYELDKGELAGQPAEVVRSSKPLNMERKPKLTLKNAFSLATTALYRNMGKTAASVLSLLIAGVLLLVSVSGAITQSGQSTFDKLFETYGQGILDIAVYDSFMSAAGTSGNELDDPKADVEQNIDGLFEKYQGDPRVEHVLFAQAFENIKIGFEGQQYAVEPSGNMPVFNDLVEGRVPSGNGMEVAVPESLVKKLGLSNREILGREIDFSGTVFSWESGRPVETPVSCTATVVGVVDTTMFAEFQGTVYDFAIEDSFFFSPDALAAMRQGAGMKPQPGSFNIRCKTPADLISVKDELNAMGIVPLGQFELVEDMVRLNQQTEEQSGTAMWVISALAFVVVLAVAGLTASQRRREFAIEKVSGFAPAHLAKMLGAESLLQGAGAAALFLAASPLLNLGTTSLWDVNILTANLLAAGMGLCLVLSVLAFAVTIIMAAATKAQNCLRTGDR